MGFLRIVYWGIAYTAGIACVTAFFLRYVFSREKLDLKLALFLMTFGLSVVCLSLKEGFSSDPRISPVAGGLALVGASLILVTFPAYALGFDNVPRRRKTAFALRIVGFALAGLNVVSIFAPFPGRTILYLATLSMLGVSIFMSMGWISRGSIQWDTKRKPFWMATLFVFFALVIVLDLFRGLLVVPLPFLKGLGGYVVLPAFYAYLNVFLLYHHITDWAKVAVESETGASADGLERHGISKREAEVLGLLRRGRTYLEMADELCVSMATIKSHVSHLYEKTGTRNKVELINLLYDSSASGGIQPKSR